MEELKVLITCSGLGSRLGEITNFTNKSLVRVGKKPTITHVIDSYPENTSFVVTIGHYGDHVKQYLNIAHKDRKIDFVEIDKYEGPGSSLAYSMFKASELLKTPFIFHACDTIVKHTIFNKEKNCVWVSEARDNKSNYRTTTVCGDSLGKIEEKGMTSSGYAYIGKSYIKDYEIFWTKIKKLISDSLPEDNILSDCHAINLMLEESFCFDVLKTKDWIDIGNIDSLNFARSLFKEDENVLDKFDESIFFINNKVIKFFYDTKIVKNRVERTKWMNDCTPKVIDQSENFFSYNLVNGEVLSRKEDFNNNTIRNLLNWFNQNLWSSITTEDYSTHCENFYIKKSLERVDKYLKHRSLRDIETTINGIKVPPAKDLILMSKNLLMSDIRTSFFHGDFILENIIYTSEKSFFLIDWRQDFAGCVKHGDCYYDLSKLNHNLIVNHDIVNDKNYKIKFKSSTEVTVDILCSKKFIDAIEELKIFCKDNKFDYKKIEVLTSIIWINMSPLHDKNFGDFLFNFGKYNLMKALKYE